MHDIAPTNAVEERRPTAATVSPPRKVPSQSIAVRGVAKRFGGFKALDDVSIEVAAGEFVTLLGPSGSGKTTLLNIIAGFIRLDAGQVQFGGRDVSLDPPHRRNLGVVFQNYALFPHLTVAENIAFPLRARGIAKAEISSRVARALDLVQLAGYGDRKPDAMSGGQRQRVALARAVVFEPAIVLMDEPLSALDKQLRERMQIELRHLHDRLGTTTVYVTHDQREALTMSDRVAVMNRGRIVQLDAPRALYENPATLFVADFIGESSVVPVAAADGQVRLGTALLRPARPLADAGGGLRLVIRSEKLLLGSECEASGNRFPGTVQEIIYQGESMLLVAEVAGGARVAMRRLCSSPAAAELPQPGQPVIFALPAESTIIVPTET